MAFAVTQSCCNDASCVSVCPVNCIHPAPGEPGFGTTEMVFIDPRSCIDCGACADACPVDAIKPVDALVGDEQAYAAINAAHFEDAPAPAWGAPDFPASLDAHAAGLRVAVVGTGPAASYAASALLTTSARVTMVDRLEQPGGLVRFGVAPDHLDTRKIGARFETVRRHPRVEMVLGTEVGRDVTHEQLLTHHDAVVYAVGASADRRLDVPGEDLAGSLPARTFVGWYNGHPEVPADVVDLTAGGEGRTGRVVVVGNGNVALDMARLLLTDTAGLAGTPLAAHALAALGASAVTEVVLVGRRGPDEAAYSLSELRPLLAREDLDVVVDGGPEVAAAVAAAAPGSKAAALQGCEVAPLDHAGPAPGRRRLVLRFHTVVERLVGDARVEAVCLAPAPGAVRDTEEVRTGLVLRSVGYRSEPVPGLPFDHATSTVPHREGRVVDPATGRPVPATYVVGWIKRGPRGGIGSNRADAAETVGAVVDDANARVISSGRGSTRSFRRALPR
ncbi:FAD-dependent oxidoreductase [Nocardioides sp. AX2bis]|uniref:FAD-dependent oxidoreductase n=1 Tax=Nocardioides sp. AX2bis TaxID=2653157 RepID=UPI0012F2B078|nr:FAD-dependent oxidoreductase [Nocardioides sp. AX2bis]VXC41431.1 putative ferredoxin/ferredoxin--NADP reductase [Nocardioides sp. AX2bis]